MGKINVLEKNVAELIAAGEVIERPASIVKELLENSIDAGASAVTVEIKEGGIGFIRITDNGTGFEKEDVPVAFLRHATSKVKNSADLEHIATLGFRGEALASIAAVSKVELLTKTREQSLGCRFVIHGGETVDFDDAGCPDGTTILVRDLFYNVPARLKFLKKNVSEGNAVQSIVEKIAISHPEVSIKLVKENKTVLHTAGDNQLISSIHAVFGREFANSLIQVDYSYHGVQVSGYISKPSFSRKNRTMQHFFVNERYVKSRTCLVALEEAYKNSIMVSRFPACVLKLQIGYNQVDVNVHPAKIEIRFVDEKSVFDAVYFAVKTALQKADILTTSVNEAKTFVTQPAFAQPEESASQMKWNEKPSQNAVTHSVKKETPVPEKVLHIDAAQYRQMVQSGGGNFRSANVFDSAKPSVAKQTPPAHRVSEAKQEQAVVEKIQKVLNPQTAEQSFKVPEKAAEAVKPEISSQQEYHFLDSAAFEKKERKPSEAAPEPAVFPTEEKERPSIRVIGELFQTYVLCEVDNTFVMIDKHAAHERILFEKLKLQLDLKESQVLLKPVKVLLSQEEVGAIREQEETFSEYGFHFRFDGESEVSVTEAPLVLHRYDLITIIQEIAENILSQKSNLTPQTLEDLLHSIACRCAIKANEHTTQEELEQLVYEVYGDGKIRHCPHGRPVGITLTKYEIEKKFGRHG
ncbi:MAG: DNA mismatch repair endonuclease MutL [Massiliimalia sp.]